VNGVVPGAQVTLFVNGKARGAPVDSIQAETVPPSANLIMVSLPVGWPPLKEKDVLTAGQALCNNNRVPPLVVGGVTVKAPLTAPKRGPGDPGGALGSNNNYLFYSPTGDSGDDCANLIDVSVTIQVTEAIVWGLTGGPPPGCPPPLHR
jgi:hypothetical protein